MWPQAAAAASFAWPAVLPVAAEAFAVVAGAFVVEDTVDAVVESIFEY